ncbi:MAG: hypothetical protein ACXWT1_02880 [Methylobacter sp.]
MADNLIINKMPNGKTDPVTMPIAGYGARVDNIRNGVNMKHIDSNSLTELFIGCLTKIKSSLPVLRDGGLACTLSAKIRAFKLSKQLGLTAFSTEDAEGFVRETRRLYNLSRAETVSRDRFCLTAMHNNSHGVVRTAD